MVAMTIHRNVVEMAEDGKLTGEAIAAEATSMLVMIIAAAPQRFAHWRDNASLLGEASCMPALRHDNRYGESQAKRQGDRGGDCGAAVWS